MQVPICIRSTDGSWQRVHWLDSKASFGDDRTHMQQMEGQYATYVNRYGPGCVIYWFGFIADLAVNISKHGASSSSSGGGGGGNGGGGGGHHSSSGISEGGVVGGGEVELEGGVHQVDVLLRDSFPAPEDIMQLPQLVGGAAAVAAVAGGA